MTIGTMATKFDTGFASLAEQLQQLRLGMGNGEFMTAMNQSEIMEINGNKMCVALAGQF